MGAARSLDAFFRPKSIAVIGASNRAGKVGFAAFANLRASFQGKLYPVNPRRSEVQGVSALAHVGDIAERLDLAVIATPAASVPSLVDECAAARVRAALILSAGFRESGPEGVALEQDVLRRARTGGVRLLGPNCLGVMTPHHAMNATFAEHMALTGNVALLSQSGALCSAILDWSLREHVGFSAFVSTGSLLDAGWGELVRYFGDDSATRSIVLYMETLPDARPFLSAAREVALKKPVIVIKSGRTEAGVKATMSHTGLLAGSDRVFDAAFRRCGVLRVDQLADVFYMAEVLGRQPRPAGPRLCIVTNAGGPGVLATDALLRSGGQLAALSPDTLASLDAMLPRYWSHANPIDLLDQADAQAYERAAELVLNDPGVDGLLAILAPQGAADPTEAARALAKFKKERKPVLASWMGAEAVSKGIDVLNRAGIPTFPYPDTAARAFEYMWQYSRNLRSLYETPSLVPDDTAGERQCAEKFAALRAAGRTLLTEVESKDLLLAYGFPVPVARLAATAEDAAAIADELGYPVAVKLQSHTAPHKSSAGGVRLGLQTADEVRAAFHAVDQGHGVSVQPMVSGEYELLLGSTIDPQFGPVLLFGLGGRLVDVIGDQSVGLPPLNTTLARRLLERTRVASTFDDATLAAIERVLVRFSRFVVEFPMVREAEVNPLLVTKEGLAALDARIVLFEKSVPDAMLPVPAIRPYPQRYSGEWVSRRGRTFIIRPIRPEDEPLIAAFHETLSETTVYRRYFSGLSLSHRIAHDRLTRVCFIDYEREMALVAEDCGRIAAVSRFIRNVHGSEAEFALIVSDEFQRQGLGTEMLRRLVETARAEGVDKLTGYVLAENVEMQDLCRKVGFTVRYDPEEETTIVEKSL